MFHGAKRKSGGGTRLWPCGWRAAALVLSTGLAASIFAAHTMPALTLERAASLDCRLSLHQHTGSCFDGEGRILCGYADFAVHTHGSGCYEDGRQVCPLPEIEAHVHRASCYGEPELLCGLEEAESAGEDGAFPEPESAPDHAAGHIHTDACYELTQTCPMEEGGGHTHTDSCYGPGEAHLACGMEEHTHTDSCYGPEENLACGMEEHAHTDACWTEGDPVLLCGQEEAEGHIHGEDCWERVLICEMPETEAETAAKAVSSEAQEPAAPGHVHSEACYGEPQLTCGREEIILHTHDGDCFAEDGRLICGMLEVREHIHDESCFPRESDLPEDDPVTDGEEAEAGEAPPEEESPWQEELPENPPADDPAEEETPPADGELPPEEDAESGLPDEEIRDEEEHPAPEEALPEEGAAPEEEPQDEAPVPEVLPEEGSQEVPDVQQSDGSGASVEKPGCTPPQEEALPAEEQTPADPEAAGLEIRQTGAYSAESGRLTYTLTVFCAGEPDERLTVQSAIEEGGVLPDSFTIWEEQGGTRRELPLDDGTVRLTAGADGAGWTAELSPPPGPVSYTITWEAAPVKDADGGFRVSGRASAQFAGASAEDVCVIAHAPEQTAYTLTVFSPDAETGAPVAGALYGLYDFRGELLATASSDAAGNAVFQEVVPDTLLCIQQIQAPAPYQPSEDRVWLHYDDADGAEIQAQLAAAVESAVFREGDRQPETVTNRGETQVLWNGYGATAEAIEIPQQPALPAYELPAAGGPGTAGYLAGGAALLLAAGLTYLLPRLKRQRP